MRVVQSKGYVIKAHKGKNSVTVVTLNEKNEWCTATSEPLIFNTPHQASIYWRAHDLSKPSEMSFYFIEGSRGGRYYTSNGERIR